MAGETVFIHFIQINNQILFWAIQNLILKGS